MVVVGSDFIDGYCYLMVEVGWIVGDVDGVGLWYFLYFGGE